MQAVILGKLSVKGEKSVLGMRRKLLAVAQLLGIDSSKAAQVAASSSDHAKEVSRDGPVDISVKITGLAQLHELCIEFSATHLGDERWLGLGFDRIEPFDNGKTRGWRAWCKVAPSALTEAAISRCREVLAEQSIEELVEALNANNQALKSSEQLFRTMFENAQIGIGVLDVKTGMHLSNRAQIEMLGYNQEELSRIGKWDEIVHPDDRATGAQRYGALVQGLRDSDEYSERFIRRDGQVVIATGRFTLIRDQEGNPQYVIALHEDITDRKRAEEALHESERLFRSIFENSLIGISFFNIEGRAVFTNRAFQDMLGYTEKELEKLDKWDEIIHPDERVSGAERFTQLVQGKREKDEWEQRFIRCDGRIIVASARFTLIRDANGKPQYVASLTEDITQKRRAEERLRASEQLFRSVFEGAQIGIGVYKIDTQEHISNLALNEMLDYTEEELNRLEQWDEISPKEERETYADRYEDLVKGKSEKDEYEQHFIRRDGRRILTKSRFQLLRDLAGNPQCVVALTEDITELRHAEEERERATRLFRSVFENAQIGIGVFDIKAGKHLSNRAQIEMLGYGQGELSQIEQWDEIVHPDDRAAGAKRYAEVVAGNQDDDEFTQRFIRPDGKIVTSIGRYKLIRGIAGEPHYVIALMEDITERLKAEQALSESERLFRSIFENAQVGISIVNVPASQYHTNRALHEMLGRTEEELSSIEKWDLIVHPDERESGAKRYAELLAGKKDHDEWEQRFIRPEGRVVIANGRFKVIRDDSGKLQYVLNLSEDITERKRAEEELRHANFLAETALELTKAGYWHIPLDGSGCYNSSPRRVALFGDIPQPDHRYRIEEFFTHAEEGDKAAANAARKAFSDAVEGRADIYDAIFAYKRPIDGQIAWGHALGRVITSADGKPTDVYGVSQDITDFKLLEAELVTAKEVAVAATKAKSDFLANISHEIRTPMNAVLGMTHLALKTDLTPRQRDYLTKSKAAAETLLGIINDTLDFSKIEAGKLKMERTEFRLDAVLDNLSTVVSHRAQEKSLEFLVAAGKNLPDALIGDPLRLGQVLINLANNAVKFTERGQIVVSVELDETASDRIKLKFVVRDSGIGLTPDQSARLFQAFSQADTSTTRKYGGTGLGLSISKRLVELMEGNIWVESEYGRGSNFCFTAWFGVGTAVRRKKVFPPGLAGIRVLVVDDNAAAREILSEMLSQLAFKVECVSSGDDALRELVKADSSDPYQIVLMDWQMPGMDGLETSRRIKLAGNLRNLPKILMITAFDREDIRLQAQEMQIEGFLLKPVSPSVLFDTLMSLYRLAGEETAIVSAGRADRDSPLVSGIRVLLVEDNEVNQQVAKELLESEGARVTIANHGAEAVKILTQNAPSPPFDVVLMDLQMPEMDGLTATRLLRAQPHLKDLPIIAMTAHVMADEVERCLDAKMNDHVAKPIDPESFFATLARWTRPPRREFHEAPARATHTQNEIALPEIQGVDVVAGLQRVAGNKRLYRDLLTQFAVKQKSVGERIAVAFESGDRNQAERLAHSLKGAAGNLGINNIFHSAGNLEKAIGESHDCAKEMIKELTTALYRQIHAIQEGLAVAADASGKGDVTRTADPVAVSVAVARLRDLLKASDADAFDAYTRLAELLKGSVDPSRLEGLSAAVQAGNFETALINLNEIANQFGARPS